MPPTFGQSNKSNSKPLEYYVSDKGKTPTYGWEKCLYNKSICILTKPPCMSLFERQLKKLHLLNNLYTIPAPKRRKAHNVENILATVVIDVDYTVLIDIDPLKGLDNPILFSEFEPCYHGEITVSRPITFTKNFFEIILCDNKSSPHRWLRDEVSILNHYTILIIELVESIII